MVLLNHIAVSVNPNEMSAAPPRCVVPPQLFDLCLHFLLELFCLKRGGCGEFTGGAALSTGRTGRAGRETGDDFTLITSDPVDHVSDSVCFVAFYIFCIHNSFLIDKTV